MISYRQADLLEHLKTPNKLKTMVTMDVKGNKMTWRIETGHKKAREIAFQALEEAARRSFRGFEFKTTTHNDTWSIQIDANREIFSPETSQDFHKLFKTEFMNRLSPVFKLIKYDGYYGDYTFI